MIWSIPVGWVKSLTQYVLIALDKRTERLLIAGTRPDHQFAVCSLFHGRLVYLIVEIIDWKVTTFLIR